MRDKDGNLPFDLIASRFAPTPHSEVVKRSLLSFGASSNFQLGTIVDAPELLRPRTLEAPRGHDIVDFSVCDIGGAAVTSAGQVLTWGLGRFGRLGLGDCMTRVCPEPVTRLQTIRITAVATASSHTVFLSEQGTVFTCGKGFLGHDPLEQEQTQCMLPRRVEGLRRVHIIFVHASKKRTCMVDHDGNAYLLGYNMENMQVNTTPRRIEALSHLRVVRLLSCNTHLCVLTADGHVFHQARNERGFQRVHFPSVHVRDRDGSSHIHFHRRVRLRVADISICNGRSICVLTNGLVYSWETNPTTTGVSSSGNDKRVPTSHRLTAGITHGLRGVFAVRASISTTHACLVDSHGDLYSWRHSNGCKPRPLRMRGFSCLNDVRCGTDFTFVSQSLRFPHRDYRHGDGGSVPSLLQMCENLMCERTNYKHVLAAFRFAVSLCSLSMTKYFGEFIASNAGIFLLDVLRHFDLDELKELEPVYHDIALAPSVQEHIRKRRQATLQVVDVSLPATPRIVRRRIRALDKKLSDIMNLELRLSRKEVLNPEQLRKVKERRVVENSLHSMNRILNDFEFLGMSEARPVSDMGANAQRVRPLEISGEWLKDELESVVVSKAPLSGLPVLAKSVNPSCPLQKKEQRKEPPLQMQSIHPLHQPGDVLQTEQRPCIRTTPSRKTLSALTVALKSRGSADATNRPVQWVQNANFPPVVSLVDIQKQQERVRSAPICIPRLPGLGTRQRQVEHAPTRSPRSPMPLVCSQPTKECPMTPPLLSIGSFPSTLGKSASPKSPWQQCSWSTTSNSPRDKAESAPSKRPRSFAEIQAEEERENNFRGYSTRSSASPPCCWGLRDNSQPRPSRLADIQSAQQIEAILAAEQTPVPAPSVNNGHRSRSRRSRARGRPRKCGGRSRIHNRSSNNASRIDAGPMVSTVRAETC